MALTRKNNLLVLGGSTGGGSPGSFTSLTSSDLTAGRVVFAGTGGLLSGDADMTFATDTLTVTKIVASSLANGASPLQLGSSSASITVRAAESNQGTLQLDWANVTPSSAGTIGTSIRGGTVTNTSGAFVGVQMTVTYNQASGTAANTDLLINRTQTAIGSGTQRSIDCQIAGTSQFNVSNIGVINACAATATPAGGSTSARLVFGTTAGFGIYYGSGDPTVSAAQGSIYIRSDGSGTANRLWVNSNGTTGWTNFVSAA